MKRCEHLSKIGHFGGNCMWSASFHLKSFKCIMAQTFLLSFPCTWFLLFNQYTWFYLFIFSPRCSQNENEQKIFYHLISCSNYLYSLLFINLFSPKSKNICFISIFLYLYRIGLLVPSKFSSCLGAWKSHLMILYTSILAQSWSLTYIAIKMYF